MRCLEVLKRAGVMIVLGTGPEIRKVEFEFEPAPDISLGCAGRLIMGPSFGKK